METEFSFTLPKGYVDEEGTVHRDGVMRLATAADEIFPMKDPRVQSNPGYLIILLLSRVITRLGTLPLLSPKIIESLYTADLAYLREFYSRINEHEKARFEVDCPHCGKAVTVDFGKLETL